jgi:hypothetical protein
MQWSLYRGADVVGADGRESDLDQALSRARRHARNAAGEALEAVRALLDAASLATSGGPAAASPLFAAADRWVSRASSGLVAGGGFSDGLAAEIAAALEQEIARWEQRAAHDDDARPVLRAFLGLREVLWELGVRASFAQRAQASRSEPEASEDHRADERRPSGDSARAAPGESAPRRVQRVAVQG